MKVPLGSKDCWAQGAGQVNGDGGGTWEARDEGQGR